MRTDCCEQTAKDHRLRVLAVAERNSADRLRGLVVVGGEKPRQPFDLHLVQEPLDVGSGKSAESVEFQASVLHDDGALDLLDRQKALSAGDLVRLALKLRQVQVHTFNLNGHSILNIEFGPIWAYLPCVADDFAELFQLLLVAGDELHDGGHGSKWSGTIIAIAARRGIE